MEIKATYNGTEYTPVESVTAGGKTALLSASADLEAIEVTIDKNGYTEIIPSAGKDGLQSVAIHTTVSSEGNVNPLLYMNNYASDLFRNKTLPNNFSVEFGESVTAIGASWKGCLYGTTPEDENAESVLTVTCHGIITNMAYCFSYTKFKKIVLNFDTSAVTDWSQCFQNSQQLVSIDGVIDFSGINPETLRPFEYCYALREVRFKPNTIKFNFQNSRYSGQNWSVDSVISLANALDPTVSGKSITMMEEQNTIIQNTMGNVQDGVFVKDANGDTTLQDFITTTKGWTIVK